MRIIGLIICALEFCTVQIKLRQAVGNENRYKDLVLWSLYFIYRQL